MKTLILAIALFVASTSSICVKQCKKEVSAKFNVEMFVSDWPVSVEAGEYDQYCYSPCSREI